MDDFAVAVELSREALILAAKLAVPLLLVALIVGLATSLIQSATQVHDGSLSVVPKLIAVGLTAIVLLPWMLALLSEYAARTIRAMGTCWS